MSELRWNPLLRTYTMVAANRANRPHMPKDWCPFCVGSGKVPDEGYDVFLYPNDFPVLKQTPDPYGPAPMEEGTEGLYHATPAHGVCEVILYSPNHTAKLYDLSVAHIQKLVALWCERFKIHAQDPKVKFIFPFENRGAEVGVTMPHPHGQLYAYSWIPLKIKTELDSCRDYYEQHGTAMLMDMNRTELASGDRVFLENDDFVAYLPYFTDFPFGLFVVSKNGLNHLGQFNEQEQHNLASMLRDIVGAFDQVYDRLFPYMMCIHQTPVNAEDLYPACENYYHFHIEFYPPLRAKDKVKWYASSETGAWAAANVVAVEDSIHLLRAALDKFKAMDA